MHSLSLLIEINVMSDSLLLFRAWLGSPGRLASILPSGTTLEELIPATIRPSHGTVLEPGAGTRVFTRTRLGRGSAPADLTLAETGAEFAAVLARQGLQAQRVGATFWNQPPATGWRITRTTGVSHHAV